MKKRQHKPPKIEYIEDGNIWPRKEAYRSLMLKSRVEIDIAL